MALFTRALSRVHDRLLTWRIAQLRRWSEKAHQRRHPQQAARLIRAAWDLETKQARLRRHPTRR